MKILRSPFVLLLVAAAVFISFRAATSDEYVFDLLAKPAYHQSWDQLIRKEKNVDTWLAEYANTKNGPASPGQTLKLGGIAYQLNMVCKAHDCGNNRFYVLFAPNGTKAWGLLLKEGTEERFFGNPDEEKKLALRAATKK